MLLIKINQLLNDDFTASMQLEISKISAGGFQSISIHIHRFGCPKDRKFTMGEFSSPKGQTGKAFTSPCSPKKGVTGLDLPHFREKIFVLGPIPRFRQIGV